MFSSQVDPEQAMEEISSFSYAMFFLRTVMLFGGIVCVWYGIKLLWEIRPVRKKKYAVVVDARVTEVTEEHRSASMNGYYIPRFEYELDGQKQYFSPKDSIRPCKLKVDDEVRLCLKENGKFRAVRKSLKPLKGIIFIVIGIALIIPQLISME
ncbi:MAG: hypothetical protein LUI06_02525 [Ruminococcus sp.]|nr:hypothetical protein [Ruminococcus sp.]